MNTHDIQPDHEKTLFCCVRVVKLWPGVEPPSLEVFRTCLDTVLGSLLQLPLPEQRVGPDTLQQPLPAPAILGSSDGG